MMLTIVLSILFDNLNLAGSIISIFPYDNAEAKVVNLHRTRTSFYFMFF